MAMELLVGSKILDLASSTQAKTIKSQETNYTMCALYYCFNASPKHCRYSRSRLVCLLEYGESLLK